MINYAIAALLLDIAGFTSGAIATDPCVRPTQKGLRGSSLRWRSEFPKSVVEALTGCIGA